MNKSKLLLMGSSTLRYLLVFSLFPIAFIPIWYQTMHVERQALPEGLGKLAMKQVPLKPPQYRVHVVGKAHKLNGASWVEASTLDKLMEGEADGIYHLQEETGSPLVVFGSRRQAFSEERQRS